MGEAWLFEGTREWSTPAIFRNVCAFKISAQFCLNLASILSTSSSRVVCGTVGSATNLPSQASRIETWSPVCNIFLSAEYIKLRLLRALLALLLWCSSGQVVCSIHNHGHSIEDGFDGGGDGEEAVDTCGGYFQGACGGVRGRGYWFRHGEITEDLNLWLGLESGCMDGALFFLKLLMHGG